MRTIIAGGRNVTDPKLLQSALAECGWKPTVVICGVANGADTLGAHHAISENIPLEFYPADWDKYGRAAGHIRNAQMADVAEALIALWDGVSKGTANMITIARKRKLKVYVHLV